MADPSIEVLGVYRLFVTDEIFEAQLPMYGDEEECRHHFSCVVLIEAIAKDLDDRFDVGAFTQSNPNYPGGYSQVAYDEALLSLDGEVLISRKPFCMRNVGSGPVRFAFYLHFYDEALPLLWSYGSAASPPIQEMPIRLQMLVPYRPCD